MLTVFPRTEVRRAIVFLMEYGLTNKELEVALLIGEGLSNEEICARRGKQMTTIKSQVYSLMGKLGKSRAGVAAWAVLHGQKLRRSRIAAGIEAGGPHKKKARETQQAQ